MARFRLVLAGPNETSIPISLQGTRWMVGRDASSDVHLNDPLVSRKHALLYLDDGALWIRDLGARNPTLVNEEPCDEERRLAPGDRITIGSTVAEVRATRELRASVVHGDGQQFDERDTLVLRKLGSEETDASLRILNSLADSLAPVQSAADASLLTLQLVLGELPVQRGLVARIGPRENLRVIASIDKTKSQDPEPVRISRGMLSLLRRERAPICLRESVPMRGREPASCLLGPLFTRGPLSGLVYLEHDGDGPGCTPKELDLASCLTRILASRLETLDLLERLRQENVHLKQGERSAPAFLGMSAIARELREKAEALANRECAITILGERGAGKETVARHIHAHAKHPRAGVQPFVVLDASPAPGVDVSDELLGGRGRGVLAEGKLCAAHEGTLCIRDVEGLPKTVQNELVRALASAEIENEHGTFPLAVRLMVTSTLPREKLFEGDSLSHGFAGLVDVAVLEVAPLRQRIEDLPLLSAHFLDELARETSRRPARVSPRAMDRLRSYPWPGNVAELRQVLTTAGILARGSAIYPKQLPNKIDTKQNGAERPRPTNLPSLEDIERQHIEHVLESVGGNKVMASTVLGIANSTLYQKMKKYAIGG